jgi:hypothetical protein
VDADALAGLIDGQRLDRQCGLLGG